MNVKKDVYERIMNMLEDQLSKIIWDIIKNTNEIKRLAEKQSVLKRERKELALLIAQYKNKAKES